MKKRQWIALVAIIVITLSGIIGYIGYRFYRHERWQSIQLSEVRNNTDMELNTIADLKGAVENILNQTEGAHSENVYTKIANKQPVNVLIVGDSIGAGSGCSDYANAWPSLIEQHIESQYGSEVTMTNISMSGESSLAGYARMLELPNDVYYDLIFVCYGQNDSEENFEIYYEALLREALKLYPDCAIISIQEHPQREYTNKMNSILKLANYYRIPVVDTIQPFQEHSGGYDSLVVDGTHPNDEGYTIFAKAVEKVLDQEIENAGMVPVYVEEPKNKEVLFFDNATWISVDSFTREGNVFSTNINEDIVGNGISNFLSDGNGVSMFVDLVDYPESNNYYIENNGNLIAEKEYQWPYSFGQRHIIIVANNVVIKKGVLSITFENEEQANGFSGCGFILGK